MERNDKPFHKGFIDVDRNGFCTESFLIRQESRGFRDADGKLDGVYREEAGKSK